MVILKHSRFHLLHPQHAVISTEHFKVALQGGIWSNSVLQGRKEESEQGEEKGWKKVAWCSVRRFQQPQSLSVFGIHVQIAPSLCESSEGRKSYFHLYLSQYLG